MHARKTDRLGFDQKHLWQRRPLADHDRQEERLCLMLAKDDGKEMKHSGEK